MTRPEDRLAPLEPEAWDARTREILAGGTPNILRTIAHHPALLEPFLGFAAALATRGVLTRRSSELLALRAAWNCRSPFEWAHHVVYARAAGLSDPEIERIALAPVHPAWGSEERELLSAADELHAAQRISDETWSALRERYDAAQLVEIPFVVGQYTMLSMVANATGVPVEPGLPALPADPDERDERSERSVRDPD